MSTLDIHSPAQSLARYPAYKDSGIEWIGEIPEHWALRKGQFLFEIVNNKSATGQDDYSSGIDPLIQQADPLVIGIGSAKQRTMV